MADEAFLELVNSLLSFGRIPGLFTGPEQEQVVAQLTGWSEEDCGSVIDFLVPNFLLMLLSSVCGMGADDGRAKFK